MIKKERRSSTVCLESVLAITIVPVKIGKEKVAFDRILDGFKGLGQRERRKSDT